VFSYVTVTDYGEYLEVAEDLNLRIMDIVAAAGSSLVFHRRQRMSRRAAGSIRQAQATEAQVQEWRARGELWLPRLPRERSPRSRTRWNTRRRIGYERGGRTAMTRRLALAALLAAALILNGCFGGVSLNEAVLGYDHTVSRLEREILLVNIARLGNGCPSNPR